MPVQPTTLEQLAQELLSRDFLDNLEAHIVYSAHCRFCDKQIQETNVTVGYFYSELVRDGWRNITTRDKGGLACPDCAAELKGENHA